MKQTIGVKDARDFLATLAEKVNKAESRDAYILAKLEEAHFNLLLNEIDLAKETIENADKVITGLEKMEPVVYGSYYRVSADYYKVKAEFGQYYKNALLLLACINLSELSEEEKLGRTIDLSLAALLSDTIYNFGDLLSHPIIETLKNSESGWLYELIFAFNGGDIGKLEGLVPKFKSQPLLLENIEFLRHKIRLMALIESVFRRQGSSDTSDRNIPFETLAQETQLPVSEIEHLVMSALSLGLIRGKIDEVDRTVFFQWVQPRYLGKAQIEGMSSRLKQWAQRTGDMKSTLENFITLEGLVKQ
ncbi:putative 26S proteasome regulatory subunit rpn9 [Zancudomyces culisetae]|uniref:Putative 26S proteasome regulatory subunit rpn9 n=1 Tax=Zancudomyces culisetae TaxID=1213189 RepID=A0A1R1PQX1_ZANCU|nr:putative 26S proteasome regulatory subunit rpn9 [Zancudomyces culisetae]OMH84002.1 putative 26S proteasome regulatory subunit rpn9 [Zancudomyces culisetae]|eukprot:OMH83272.1 putative 26S proteasome regulatory subunit rpn9 [Zancudomyces culisetae]